MRGSDNYIDWDEKYNVGIKIIDKQHRHFINTMNRLFIAIQSDTDHTVSKLIEELSHYADKHFKTEEEYFKKFNYPYSKEHSYQHEAIRAEINDFLAIKDQDPFKVGYKLLDLLEDWLFNHIATYDKKYIQFFKEHGVH